MPSFLAISEFSGSIIIRIPDQSSLKLEDLQFGHIGPELINLQFLHAFSTS
jgi:hypothetical protein